MYRPPHVGLYANKLKEHLRTCGEEFCHKIIMGDLNADLLKPDDTETRALLNLVKNHSLKKVKRGASYYTRTTTTDSDTHIDVILGNKQDRFQPVKPQMANIFKNMYTYRNRCRKKFKAMEFDRKFDDLSDPVCYICIFCENSRFIANVFSKNQTFSQEICIREREILFFIL